jgi:hypothetical protein
MVSASYGLYEHSFLVKELLNQAPSILRPSYLSEEIVAH